MITTIQGIRYAYEVSGNGAPLLLLHGFTGSKATWKPFIPLWSQRYRTIAVDIIGHGESDSPDQITHYTMEAFACTLEILLQNLGIQKTNILGYSMGGRIALYLTVKRPELIRAVLLESASPGLETKEERLNRIQQDEALADFITENGLIAFVNRWESLPLFASQKNASGTCERGYSKGTACAKSQRSSRQFKRHGDRPATFALGGAPAYQETSDACDWTL